jgi:hypothetical protein
MTGATGPSKAITAGTVTTSIAGATTLTMPTGVSATTYPIIFTQGWYASGAGSSMVVIGVTWSNISSTWNAVVSLCNASTGNFYVLYYYQ